MKHQTEINGFTIFLVCSLVPLVSLAPTVIPEGKITAVQKQRHSTTRIKPLASVLAMKATTLFKNYSTCSSVTPQTVSWLTADSWAEEMVKKIPECPAFDTDCCAFHDFHTRLKNMRSDIEEICGKAIVQCVDATLYQLATVLSERPELDACGNEDLLQADTRQIQGRKTAEKMTYIWQLLQKYERFMQNTTKMYSSTDV